MNKKHLLALSLILIMSLQSCSNSSSNASSINSSTSSDSSFTTTEPFNENEYKSFTLSSSSGYDLRYSDGSYGTSSASGYSFSYYRAYSSSIGSFIKLINNNSPFTSISSLPGSFFNTTPINGIRRITLTYKTSSSIEDDPYVLYGNSLDLNNKVLINSTVIKQTINIDIPFSNYFKICTGNSVLDIQSLVVYYSDNNIEEEKPHVLNSNNYRINPVTYKSTLVDGKSYVDIPYNIDFSTSPITYQTKRYTYYSYSYIKNNPSLASKAQQTAPEDVSAYYTAFKEFPANYVKKNNYTTAISLFGSATRCVSTYNRTNGYVTSFPANISSGFVYYELDIALSQSYSYSSRGTGRVVALKSGFKSPDYDSSPVCVYTDDHYASFAEYLNHDNAFGERFNGEINSVGFSYNAAQTKQFIV